MNLTLIFSCGSGHNRV